MSPSSFTLSCSPSPHLSPFRFHFQPLHQLVSPSILLFIRFPLCISRNVLYTFCLLFALLTCACPAKVLPFSHLAVSTLVTALYHSFFQCVVLLAGWFWNLFLPKHPYILIFQERHFTSLSQVGRETFLAIKSSLSFDFPKQALVLYMYTYTSIKIPCST